MKKGPYKVLSSKTVYKNPWMSVREDKVIYKGKEKSLGIVDYKPGVSVVALDAEDNIYLIKEYYYAISEYGIQVPSGGVEKNQTSLDAAKEELLEETGLTGKKWISLGFIHPLTFMLNCPADLFLAFDLKQKGKPEKGIELLKIPFDEAYQMVIENKIVHAPSIVSILKAKIWLENNKSISKC